VLTGNVGGSFGMKSQVYPEYFAIIHAAKTLGRPVERTDERGESFVSDSHGRPPDDVELDSTQRMSALDAKLSAAHRMRRCRDLSPVQHIGGARKSSARDADRTADHRADRTGGGIPVGRSIRLAAHRTRHWVRIAIDADRAADAMIRRKARRAGILRERCTGHRQNQSGSDCENL
jgi:hypothetical protein